MQKPGDDRVGAVGRYGDSRSTFNNLSINPASNTADHTPLHDGFSDPEAFKPGSLLKGKLPQNVIEALSGYDVAVATVAVLVGKRAFKDTAAWGEPPDSVATMESPHA